MCVYVYIYIYIPSDIYKTYLGCMFLNVHISSGNSVKEQDLLCLSVDYDALVADPISQTVIHVSHLR